MPNATDANSRILVVDDEGLIAADLQARLVSMGYSVPKVATSGKEAYQIASAEPFDLILMDIRLDGKTDGIGIVQALKAVKATPVVYLTAYADRNTIARAALTDPLGYLVKPIADAELRSTIEIAIYRHKVARIGYEAMIRSV